MNIADPAIFKRSSTAGGARPSAGTFNLVYHGTMAERLGVDLIIRAAAQLRERVPGAAPAPVGARGRSRQRFSSWPRSSTSADAVVFRPKGYPLQELPSHLSSMDLGVVGNRRSAACDSDAAGQARRIRVAWNTGGRASSENDRALLLRRHGGFYEPEDVQSLADAIYRLYTRTSDLVGCRPRRASRFLGHYGWDRQGAEFVNFYQTLVEN